MSSSATPSVRFLSPGLAVASDARLERFHRIAHEILSNTLRVSDTHSLDELEKQFVDALDEFRARRRSDFV